MTEASSSKSGVMLAAARGAVAHAFGVCVAGTLGWLAVCSVELRDLALGIEYAWIALIHLARVSFWFSIRCAAVVLVLQLLQHVLARYTKYASLIVAMLVAAAFAQPAWNAADAIASGNLLGESEHRDVAIALLTSALSGVYAVLWLHHSALCRVQQTRRWWWTLLLWLGGAAALAVLVEAIDHHMRAYLFVAKHLVPAAWLLALTSFHAVGLRLPKLARVTAGTLGAVAIAAAFGLLPPLRGLHRVQNDFARLAGVASLSDFAADRQRGAQLAALDFSRPERFDCEAKSKLLPAMPRPDSHRNVILISVDALRKDAIFATHEGAPLMPSLAGFVREGLSFERAVTTYPATLFAVGSALTGLGPSEVLLSPEIPHSVFTRAKQAVEKQHIYLPQSYWFRKQSVRRLIIQRTPSTMGSSSRYLTDRLLAQLRDARDKGERLFTWIHYYDPHGENVQRMLPEARQEEYRIQTQTADTQIGRVLAALRELKYFDDSLVIFFADHGEALGELGFFGHHVYLNHFLTDVPLVVRAPGLQAGRDRRTTTLADIAPTILQWLGLRAPRTDARSLLEPEKPGDARYVVSEAFPLRGGALFDVARSRITSIKALERRIQSLRHTTLDYAPKVAITTAKHRLIVNRETGAEELYDREQDPTEQRNLAGESLPVHDKLKHELAAWAVRQSESIYCAVARP